MSADVGQAITDAMKSQRRKDLVDAVAPYPTINRQEHRLSELAIDAISRHRANEWAAPVALVFHPGDLTERMLLDGVTLWGLEVRHSDTVEPGTVRVW